MKETPNITAALLAVQAEIEAVPKTSINPHFKNRYADLATVWSVARPVLNKHGIAVVQKPVTGGGNGGGLLAGCVTELRHTSGEIIESTLLLPVSKPDAQGVGSALTYARRYALAAMVGLAPEDDDGEGAVGRRTNSRTTTSAHPEAKPEDYDIWIEKLDAVTPSGFDAWFSQWKATPDSVRRYRMSWEATAHAAQKEKAKSAEPVEAA